MKKIYLSAIFCLLFSTNVFALNLARVKTWTDEILTATDLNAEFDNIINHAITNDDISATAAIAGSKLSLAVAPAIGGTTPNTGAFTTISATGAVTLNGDVTLGNAAADTVYLLANDIYFEGTTDDTIETILTAADPTDSDKTITLPNITGTVVTSAGAGADIDVGTYEVRANTFESDVATGTAPFTIASTTVSTNLNADLLDGSHASTTTGSAIIPIADASGYLPNDSVDTTALKTTTGEVSTSTTDTLLTLPGGEYGFYPQIKASDGTSTWIISIAGRNDAAKTLTTSYATHINMARAGGSGTFYAQQRYVTASGEDFWLFLLVDKKTGDILSAYASPDHPAYGNGGDFDSLPHPFCSYDKEEQEIILVDKDTCISLRQESRDTGNSILTLVNEEYKPNMEKEEVYKPLHSGKFLTENKDGKQIQVKQMVQKLPDYIKVRKLIKNEN